MNPLLLLHFISHPIQPSFSAIPRNGSTGFITNKPGAPALHGGLKSYFKGDPDIQIYQLNNSLQYQRGSHARHMHFLV